MLSRAKKLVQSRFAETLTLTLNPNFGESGRHQKASAAFPHADGEREREGGGKVLVR